MNNPVKDATKQLPETKKWVVQFARFGYAAKGVIYVIVGVLSAMAAFGAGGQTTGKKGVLLEIIQQPFGKFLLGIVAIGFVCYGIWRWVQAIQDPEDHGNDVKGYIIRAGYIISGALYLYFAYYAYQLISTSTSNEGGKKFLIAQILDWSGGQIIVGLIAVIVFAKGIFQIVKVVSDDYNQGIKNSGLNEKVKQTYRRMGLFGLISRAVVFGIIGFFVAKAAFTANASQAKGTSGAFNFITAEAGPILMGIIAIGLVGYGLYEFIKARYKPFNIKG